MDGEGAAVSATAVRQEGGPPGEVMLHLELNNAPAPTRSFVADGVNLIQHGDVFHLVFLQNRLDGKSVRALLDVHMTERALLSLAKGMSVIAPDKPGNFSEISEEPEQAIAFAANFARIAHNITGCVFDFFYASPFSLQASSGTSQLHLEGVVRVQLGLTAFATMAHAIVAYKAKESK